MPENSLQLITHAVKGDLNLLRAALKQRAGKKENPSIA